MPFIDTLPVWVLALSIFCLRITDVSIGTLRTIFVVQGRIRFSVLLGFFEVLIWITAISQVFSHVRQQPYLLLAYAGGFAVGNAVGIFIERKMALGTCELRIISVNRGGEIAEKLRSIGHTLTTFNGEGRDGPRVLLNIICSRREVGSILRAAREIDMEMNYIVERVSDSSSVLPIPHMTGWRAVFKKK
ncbi:MAG: hypothetical protein KJ970_17585 [Candidatus Eisenbacteria bacterium]|uniref:Uncharacterized protein n=1 Tax=Eiseniibacteriota bacterium TaxID=2212470 RepID=A0A948RZY4_UNCEI|nr:hypothetical protein [Candidatus Eisenbacteria bacterium]MBU1949664.1 hypothetical protein [Candidatus Eisenbacteria bacterium]MBU2692732.1 hypothetical protein [Candidatus Eisenbacteria bacterium]